MISTDNPKNSDQLISIGSFKKILFNHNHLRHQRSILSAAQ
jgi:hypothetical protein